MLRNVVLVVSILVLIGGLPLRNWTAILGGGGGILAGLLTPGLD